MQEQVKVSVYCMAYNHASYIRDTLEGFVNQITTFPFEVYVHDDASTDGTADIIREYAQKYPHIIKPVLQTENQYSKGTEIIRTYLVPRFHGQYIAMCEGDDYWTDPCKLQLQADFLDAHPDYSACVHNTLFHHTHTGEEHLFHPARDDHDISFEDVLRGGVYHLSSLMYRTSYARIIYSDHRPPFYAVSDGFGDYPLGIHLSLEGKIRCLNRTMSFYRYMTPGSWTSQNEASIKQILQHHKKLTVFLNSMDTYTDYRHTKLLRATCRSSLTNQLKHFAVQRLPGIHRIYQKLLRK